jgi:hypothetical protein
LCASLHISNREESFERCLFPTQFGYLKREQPEELSFLWLGRQHMLCPNRLTGVLTREGRKMKLDPLAAACDWAARHYRLAKSTSALDIAVGYYLGDFSVYIMNNSTFFA